MIWVLRACLAGAWLVCVAGLTHAQSTTKVLSGEHDSFSRLAFKLLPEENWTLTRKGSETIVLSLDGDGPALDIGNVFDLIPRTRIAGVRSENRTLTLTLACPCAVDVFRTDADYLAIDVGYQIAPQKTVASSPARVEPAVELPIVLEPVDFLPRPLQITMPPVEAINTAVSRSAPQFTILDRRRETLLPGDTEAGDMDVVRKNGTACLFEGIARRAFDADPVEALDQLATTRSNILSGQDVVDADAVMKLVDQYLAAGWGAEAMAALDQGLQEGPDRRLLAAAFDMAGSGRVAEKQPDPTCGPASALAFLMLGGPEDKWSRANSDEALIYLDRLPTARRSDILPSIEQGLARLGNADLLVGIPQQEDTSNDSPLDIAEAGTDLDAVRSLQTRFSRSNGRFEPVDDIWLANAVALLPSVPDGQLRDAFEGDLALALLFARYPGDAVELAVGRPDRAADLAAAALDGLEAEDAVEVLTRLSTMIPKTDPVAARARDLLTQFGLSEMAARFGTVSGDSDSNNLPIDDDADPWLNRNLAAVQNREGISSLPRIQVAELIVARNAPQPPAQSDYADAQLDVSRSRAMRSAIEALIANPTLP